MRKALKVFIVSTITMWSLSAQSAPGYDQGRADLEWVMEYLIEHFPGTWDSYPQVWFERNVRMPTQEGEHEHWHRTFARIDAPQIGEVVFYGQINVGGRDGPIIGGSQVLYHAVIDEDLGAVNIFGQGPANPEQFENLQDRPELWSEVQWRERDALNCDWIWRRDGDQKDRGHCPDRWEHVHANPASQKWYGHRHHRWFQGWRKGRNFEKWQSAALRKTPSYGVQSFQQKCGLRLRILPYLI